MDQLTINYNLAENQIHLKLIGCIDKRQLFFLSNFIVEMTIEQGAQLIHLDFYDSIINMDLIEVYKVVDIFEELSLTKKTKISITPSKDRIHENFFLFFEKVLKNHDFEVLIAEPSI